jgi:prepilin-type N-terminal cleavage/methylation domain-containing protein
MRFSAFTLVELLVVTAVIAILLGFLIPALSPNSGRALEGDARNFTAQLESAQLMALAKRTKTRVLIATTNDWGPNASWRAYLLTSYDGSSGNWLQQGKLNRLSQATTFDSTAGIVAARSTTATPVVRAPNITPTPTPAGFTGAYVEFLPNGSTSLNPSATPELIAIQEGFVPTAGSSPTPVRKNQALRSELTVDPLTGNAVLK